MSVSVHICIVLQMLSPVQYSAVQYSRVDHIATVGRQCSRGGSRTALPGAAPARRLPVAATPRTPQLARAALSAGPYAPLFLASTKRPTRATAALPFILLLFSSLTFFTRPVQYTQNSAEIQQLIQFRTTQVPVSFVRSVKETINMSSCPPHNPLCSTVQ